MSDMELVDTYIQMLADTLDAEGIYPMPAVVSGKQNAFYMYDCSPQHMLDDIQVLMGEHLSEIIFGLDSYTAEGQGTTLDSAVIIFHLQRAGTSRIGVWEYSWNEGQPVTYPVNWENAWWRDVYAKMLTMLDTAIKGH